MSTGEIIQLLVFLVTVGSLIWAGAKKAGGHAQKIESLDNRIEKVEKRVSKLDNDRPIPSDVCSARTSDYRAALSEAIATWQQRMDGIERRLDTMEQKREVAANEWQTRLTGIENAMNTIQVSIARISETMQSTQRLLDLVVNKVFKEERER